MCVVALDVDADGGDALARETQQRLPSPRDAFCHLAALFHKPFGDELLA